MKTKTIAVLEVLVVLCSVFLVALPAIAADQNQATQKVSASTVTATSEIYEPGPLDVFGNANEDDLIDMRDTTYIKLAIFGKKPKTDLADANYDGKVSMLDVGQTKLIILGKEKKITYIDILGDAETVNKPIKRLANLGSRGPIVARSLNAMDIMLPITGGTMLQRNKRLFPVMSKWTTVGNKPDSCDFEYVLSLNPDAVQTNIESLWAIPAGQKDKREFKEKLPGIPIICLNMREPNTLPQNVRTYGYILDKEAEAEEFMDWFEGWMNTLKSRTEGLSEDERPRVLIAGWSEEKFYKCITPSSRYGQALVLAGGKNILDAIVSADDPRSSVQVDPEWVVEQIPDFIMQFHATYSGYDVDDPSDIAARRQRILDRPELANTNAVKNKRVYLIENRLCGGAGNSPIGTAYMAKLFQPDLFKDIDPREIHQEYLDKFCHIDFNVYEQGVFIYPPLV